MQQPSTPRFTLAEYLALEEVAQFKNDFYRGQISPRIGCNIRHNIIVGNITAQLHNRLRKSDNRVCNSDQRIRVPAVDLDTYPDASVVCGQVQLDTEDPNAIINPCVIIEVLSPSTECFDRGKKFDLYREIHTLQEYILVVQDQPHVERFVRQAAGIWNLTFSKGLASKLTISSIAFSLPLADVYEDVKFVSGGESATAANP